MRTLTASEASIVGQKTFGIRLITFLRVRWIAVVGQLAAVAYVYFVLGFSFPVALCVTAITASAWINVVLAIRFPAGKRLTAPFATALLAFDVVQLTLLLYLTGGIENPFAMLLVVPVIVSATTMPIRNAIGLALLTSASIFVLIYQHQPFPWYDGLPFQLPFLYKLGVASAILCSMVFLSLYAWRLAEESRQMSAALAATESILSREQKLHALDGLAAAAAHELGTPLSTISLVTKELMNQRGDDPELVEDMTLLRSQAERCREILQKLTRAPDAQDPMHASISVREMIDEAAAAYLDNGVAIKVAVKARSNGDEATSHALREPLGQRQPGVIFGLGNLIENAVDYARSEVIVTADWAEDTVSIAVADDGPGFPSEIMDTLGEPYVTTRGSSANRQGVKAGGLGLGFFIAKTLLERSGATVELDNAEAPLTGAIVNVSWPRTVFEQRPSWP